MQGRLVACLKVMLLVMTCFVSMSGRGVLASEGIVQGVDNQSLASNESGPMLHMMTAPARRQPDPMSERVRLLELRVDELNKLLTEANRQLDLVEKSGGRLQALEHKAAQYDLLTLTLDDKTGLIAELQNRLADTEAVVQRLESELAEAQDAKSDIEARYSELEATVEPMRTALRTLRLGKYEYYTIKPGDTLESIAAQPMIYGDAAKAALLRQANVGHLSDLDSLIPGEVLLVPRLEGTSRYEF